MEPIARVLLLADPAMQDHDPGPYHPERPERLRAILAALEHSPSPHTVLRSPQPVSREVLERAHEPRYLDQLEALRGQRAELDPDTRTSSGSLIAAELAAGAAVQAVEAVLAGEVRRAFALVRPPGHHAESNRARGFCLLNNVAVAVAHARALWGLQRVLVVDWDVHHGNGTQQAFFSDPGVLYFSTHRYPFYPGTGSWNETGAGDGEGFTVNVPLPPGLNDSDHVLVYESLLPAIADAYAPQLVVVSAGFDSHARDPLGGMRMTEQGFATLCALVRDIADKYAGGKLVLVLEGGYDLRALGQSVRACIGVLAGSAPLRVIDTLSPHTASVLRQARRVHGQYWTL